MCKNSMSTVTLRPKSIEYELGMYFVVHPILRRPSRLRNNPNSREDRAFSVIAVKCIDNPLFIEGCIEFSIEIRAYQRVSGRLIPARKVLVLTTAAT